MENTVSLTLIGIPNCDQIKKARTWLDKKHIPYTFRDFRTEPLAADEIRTMARSAGLEVLINKRSTTWRTLGLQDGLPAETLIALAAEHPTLLKRPVVFDGRRWSAGMDENEWEARFK